MPLLCGRKNPGTPFSRGQGPSSSGSEAERKQHDPLLATTSVNQTGYNMFDENFYFASFSIFFFFFFFFFYIMYFFSFFLF